jgi:putative ATP-dependent endonuclease of the OLD family
MAKKAKPLVVESDSDLSPINQRLVKLIVKNFRCIGVKPVEIDLNDIVVLVGANNVGKSSILKAYELVMSEGSAQANLTIDDFPNSQIDEANYPEIELHIVVNDSRVGDQWLHNTGDGEWLVKERWTWRAEGKPTRQGWNVAENSWSNSFPFGPANIANARRPEPHKVSAFDKPENQADAIKKLLMAAIKERVKNLQSTGPEGGANDYHQLVESVKRLQQRVLVEAQDEINSANAELTRMIERVFPNYKIDFDARPEDGIENSINLFSGRPELLMGPEGGYQSTIEKQGSGARRTLMWTALKFISETNRRARAEGVGINRPHLLLIDEPEICLHPSAIREACSVLYSLPDSGNWQVMVTTHSPIFIDFSRDNTTIIRVEKNRQGEIAGTTVFRPDKARLSNDDKKNLKFLNLCDTYFAEFLFGGRVIIVEGDTEYTALNYIIAKNPDTYKGVHIIRARGKATIVSLIKILNHFGSSYSVLHDSDAPQIRNKKGNLQANPAWGNNPNILEAVQSKPSTSVCRLLASLPNFESAYFGEDVYEDKPYNALMTIMGDEGQYSKIEQLLVSLIDHTAPVPENCMEWDSIESLEAQVRIVLGNAE